MSPKFLVLFIFVLTNSILTRSQDVETNKFVDKRPILIVETTSANESATTDKASLADDLVKIQLYYECLCPDCRNFDTTAFKQTVLELGSHLDIHLYPYGKARTVDNGGGNYSFICQHGPAECYGNKLHACAIDALQNITLAVLYNSCLMDLSHGKGSDDAAADVCGTSMSIDSTPIKECAKGAKGSELLKIYGDESKIAAFKTVPHILINGVEVGDDHFKRDVCKVFKIPPLRCKQ